MNKIYNIYSKKNEIDERILKILPQIEQKIKNEFQKAKDICESNSLKILAAFREEKISTSDFTSTTGYGYFDSGREKIGKIYSKIFGTEAAIVRHSISSATEAIYVVLSALLCYGDTLVSLFGEPYPTVLSAIGKTRDCRCSIINSGVNYNEINLKNNEFDYEAIKEYFNKTKPKVALIQRSCGYNFRKSFSVEKINELISFIREINRDTILVLDNCYGEFVEEKEPLADVIIGSLTKNPGGGIVRGGAYITGNSQLIDVIGERLTAPGLGNHVGANFGTNRELFLGLFLSPKVVTESLKTSIFASTLFSELGFPVCPEFNSSRTDIIQSIKLGSREKLIKFCQAIQTYSPIDCNLRLLPNLMPGYETEVIMACGSFTEGASIEFSADAPLLEPFAVYIQGSLNFFTSKFALLKAASAIL